MADNTPLPSPEPGLHLVAIAASDNFSTTAPAPFISAAELVFLQKLFSKKNATADDRAALVIDLTTQSAAGQRRCQTLMEIGVLYQRGDGLALTRLGKHLLASLPAQPWQAQGWHCVHRKTGRTHLTNIRLRVAIRSREPDAWEIFGLYPLLCAPGALPTNFSSTPESS